MRARLLLALVLMSAPAFAVTDYYIDSASGVDAPRTCLVEALPCDTWTYLWTQIPSPVTDAIVIHVADGSLFTSADAGGGTLNVAGGCTVASDIINDTGGGKSAKYILAPPDLGCTVTNTCTIQAETNVEITPEVNDLVDEEPNWGITDRGNGDGCLLIVGDGSSDNNYWTVTGFECNTDAGIAICKADNILLQDWIGDFDTNAVEQWGGWGQYRALYLEQANNITLDDFRMRGVTEGNETPAWTCANGPGSTGYGVASTRGITLNTVDTLTVSDFYLGHFRAMLAMTCTTLSGNCVAPGGSNITFKRGGIMTGSGHGFEISSGAANWLIENVVEFGPDWGHCWNETLPESTKTERDNKRASITSKRCRVATEDTDCAGEGPGGNSIYCREEDFDCDTTNPHDTESSSASIADMTGWCGTANEETSCIAVQAGTSHVTGQPCTIDTDCDDDGTSGFCGIANQIMGTFSHAFIGIYEVNGLIVRNNTYTMRDDGYPEFVGPATNVMKPTANRTAISAHCTTTAAAGALVGGCDISDQPTAVRSAALSQDCTGLVDADCDTWNGNCGPVCVWDGVKVYNNVVFDLGHENVARDTFINWGDHKMLKIGPGDAVFSDYNVYSGDIPQWKCMDYQVSPDTAHVKTTLDTDATTGWLTAGICQATDSFGAQTPDDYPATTNDDNSIFITQAQNIRSTTYLVGYTTGDYRPVTGGPLDAATTASGAQDGDFIDYCASEDYYGTSRVGLTCTPGAFLPQAAAAEPSATLSGATLTGASIQ